MTSYTVVHASAVRPDGRAVTWSVSLHAGLSLRVEGEIEIDAPDDEGTDSLFHRVGIASDAEEAAQLIAEFAAEVVSQVDCFISE